MKYWNKDWTLERAGFGGAGGGMPGIRGITCLMDDVLATFPRDETRGCLLQRTAKLSAGPVLDFQVSAAPGHAWQLSVYAGNRRLLEQIITGADGATVWTPIHVDLKDFAGREVTLRLYQRTLLPTTLRLPGDAYWKTIILQ